MQTISALDYARRHCSRQDRVLLINPPVVETRYQWVRWNQPLDLLKLSSFLKQENGCEVRLFDFMLPTNGRVARCANRTEPEIKIDGYSYPLWRYGRTNEEFSKWLDRLVACWRPTQILITSLTSYWWKGISQTVCLIKNKLADVRVALYGQYSILEPEHAKTYSFADTLITDRFDLTDRFADFDLYEEHKPAFCALDVRSHGWVEETVEKLQTGVSDFTFFNDDFLQDPETNLLPGMKALRRRVSDVPSKRRLRFHAICGLNSASFTEQVAAQMKDFYSELHFEYQTDLDGELDIQAYRSAKRAYQEAGFKLDHDQVSGFVMIGLPGDNLERIVRHMLNLFELLGSVILKPYSPTPGTETYRRHEFELEPNRIELLSPHFFPFSKTNGIARKEYDELYTLAASLNHKVRSKAFDLFPGKLAYEMIRTSFEREVWKLAGEKSATD